MTELLHNSACTAQSGTGNECFSVMGSCAWAGEGPSFFIPAAKLMIGRVFVIMGELARRAIDGIRQVCWRTERRQGRFFCPGAAVTGRLVSRRL